MNKLIIKFQASKKITLGLLLALFVLVNWLNYGLYVRADLSASGRYRLTKASKDILRNLPEKVTIEAYFSKDISEAYMQPVKQLKDFLEEYASSSRGKVHLMYLNPDEDEKIMQKARSLGIQPMPIGSVDRKKQEVSRVFLSLAIYYEDKTQVIPDILRQSQALEYFLTANIYKMAHPMEHNIGLLETDGEFSKTSEENPFHSLEIIDKSMQTFYGNLISVKADTEEISDNVSVLLIASPKKLTEMEKYHIDQFIMRGGKLIIASGGVDINFNNLMATPKDKDILEFYQNYGIQIHSDMVYEAKNYIPFRQPVNMLQMIEIPYPVWLAIPSENLNQESLLTKNFKFLVFPWASSITLEPGKIKDSKITLLASTSSQSWVKSDALYISPEILKNALENPPTGSELKSSALAYDIRGIFTSYFSNRKLPPGINNFIRSGNPAQIVVVSTPFAFTNNIQPVHLAQGMNINFFLSILDIMNGMDELVKSRNRNQIENPMIGPIDSWMKNLIVIFNFMLPLIFIAGYALLRFINRNRLSQKVYIPLSEQAKAGELNA